MIKEYYDLTADERKVHDERFGGFNDFPPGWREVSEAEIATESMGRVYSPVLYQYRQMLTPDLTRPMIDARLEFFHDRSGQALVYDCHDKRLRWFRFEHCKHTLVETSRPAGHRSGLHEAKCTKCDYTTGWDTSD